MPAERSRLLRIADLQRHAVVPDTGAAGDGQILPLGKADGLPVVEGDILLQYIAGQIQQEAVQVTRGSLGVQNLYLLLAEGRKAEMCIRDSAGVGLFAADDAAQVLIGDV